MKASKLLIRESPLQALPTLIQAVGTSEAIILQQIHYASIEAAEDGGWVERSISEWHRKTFWCWHVNTVRRAFEDLAERGLVDTEIVATKAGRRSRVRVDHDALDRVLEGSYQNGETPSHQNGETGPTRNGRPHTLKGVKERTEEEPPEPPQGAKGIATGNESDPVQLVFDAWRGSTGHLAAVLDIARRRVIEKGLKSHGLDDLVDAVRGWRHSPHHRGENERRTVYNELKLLLRDAAQIEKFRDLERQHTPTAAASTCPAVVDPKLADRWDDVVVPELHRAVDDSVFDIWLAGLHPHRIDGDQLILAAPPELAEWVGERFQKILDAVTGRPVRVEACNRSTSTEGRAAA